MQEYGHLPDRKAAIDPPLGEGTEKPLVYLDRLASHSHGHVKMKGGPIVIGLCVPKQTFKLAVESIMQGAQPESLLNPDPQNSRFKPLKSEGDQLQFRQFNPE